MENNIYDDEKKKSRAFYEEYIKPKNKFKKARKTAFRFTISLILSFSLGLSLSLGFVFTKDILIPKLSANVEKNSAIPSSSTGDKLATPNIKTIIKEATSSVVSITSLTSENNFFNIPIQSEGAGSGIIFHRSGTKTYILTNNHVVDGAFEVGVAFDDSELLPAMLVGKDQNADLAVISVDNASLTKAGIKNVKIARFGNSDYMQEGDSVIAIGNALGEGKTATLGIISSKSKEIVIGQKALNVLQTTAAINPGNSGGALINSNGEVIGINTAKIADSDINRIGYSLSSNIAIPVVERIMNNQNPASLGVYVADATKTEQNSLGFGAIVIDLIDGGSAQKAGINRGDIITSINQKPIFNSEQLVEEIKNYQSGETIAVKLIRNGKTLDVKIKLYKQNMSTNF